MSSNCSSSNSFQSNKDFKAALKDLKKHNGENSTDSKLTHHHQQQQQSQSFNLTDHFSQTHSFLPSKLKPPSSKTKNSYHKIAQRNLMRTHGFRAPDSTSKILDLLQQNSNDSQSFEQNYNENKEYDNSRSDQMISSQLNDNFNSNSPLNFNAEEARFKSGLPTNPFFFKDENKTFTTDSYSNQETVTSKMKQSSNKLKLYGSENEADNSLSALTASKYISNLLHPKLNSFEPYIVPTTSNLAHQAKSFAHNNNSISNTSNGPQRLFDLNSQNSENKILEDSYSCENIYQPKINTNILSQPWVSFFCC